MSDKLADPEPGKGDAAGERGKHTPGPWIDAGDGWIDGPTAGPVVQYAACGTHRAEWPNRNDYRLAMAAPDLLAACRLVSDFLDRLETSYPEDDSLLRALRLKVHEPLRAALNPAIAKAEGRS